MARVMDVFDDRRHGVRRHPTVRIESGHRRHGCGSHGRVSHGGYAFGVIHHTTGAESFGDGLSSISAAIERDDDLDWLSRQARRRRDAFDAAPDVFRFVVSRYGDRKNWVHNARCANSAVVEGNLLEQMSDHILSPRCDGRNNPKHEERNVAKMACVGYEFDSIAFGDLVDI